MGIVIEYGEDRSLSAEIGGREVHLTLGDKSETPGPTPADMFLFALGGCVAVYAASYARRHDIPTAGMKVEVEGEPADKPRRLGAINFKITMPGPVPEKHRAALLRSARQCYLHNTIKYGPKMEITLN